jgi:hypothetical protein
MLLNRGFRFMAKSASCSGSNHVLRKQHDSDFDYLKFVLTVARKNGWDLAELGLVPKDLPTAGPVTLTKKQLNEHNRLVKKALQPFSEVITPPAPLDLERSILNKDKNSWLPWEREVVEKVGDWRAEMTRARPDILRQLGVAVEAATRSAED